MDSKNYTEVLIDGRIYTLGGAEDESYLQRVASYINEKHSQLKKRDGFLKQSGDYQSVMVELNIADDYFKAKEEVDKPVSYTHLDVYKRQSLFWICGSV